MAWNTGCSSFVTIHAFGAPCLLRQQGLFPGPAHGEGVQLPSYASFKLATVG